MKSEDGCTKEEMVLLFSSASDYLRKRIIFTHIDFTVIIILVVAGERRIDYRYVTC